jgi:hypothetical protein
MDALKVNKWFNQRIWVEELENNTELQLPLTIGPLGTIAIFYGMCRHSILWRCNKEM